MRRIMRPMLCAIVWLAVTGSLTRGQVDIYRPSEPDPSPRPPASSEPKAKSFGSAELVEGDIVSLMQMVSDETGQSVLISPALAEKPPKVKVLMNNIEPSQLLQQVASITGIAIEEHGNTIHVMTFDEHARIYGVEKRVVQLNHADARKVAAVLSNFVESDGTQTAGGERVVAEVEGNRLVLHVRRALLTSFEALIRKLDVPFEKDTVKVVRLEHLEAQALVPALEAFVHGTATDAVVPGAPRPPAAAPGATARPEATPAPRAGEQWLLHFMIEPKLNAVILRGSAADIERAVTLIRQLDVESELRVVAYELKFTNAAEVYETLSDLLEQDASFDARSQTGRRMRISTSEQNNRIVVVGTDQDHARFTRMVAAIDRPLAPGSGGVRVYRLENASSAEVASVIADMIEQRTGAIETRTPTSSREHGDYVTEAPPPYGAVFTPPDPGVPEPAAEPAGEGLDIVVATVSEAPEINAVIIRASAAEHEEFAAVIAEMDKPRDQVLLEVTIVTVTSSDAFDLGVELGGARVGDVSTNVVGFSSFGIGAVDTSTGTISLPVTAPFGANLAIFNAGDFSLVINALRTIGKVRVTSTPKILVQDNAEAEIRQLNQEPFESTSRTAGNPELTAFGGFVDAGTTLTVIPHISKDQWLRLEYVVQLSSFGTRTQQQADANLPPPRRESNSRGTVRVPADHIVVLGGLAATRDDKTVSEIPFLGRVPLFGHLFKDRSTTNSKETLFIFIRPVILRDPSFEDLRSISEPDIEEAGVESDTPTNPMKLFVPQMDVQGN